MEVSVAQPSKWSKVQKKSWGKAEDHILDPKILKELT